MHTLSEATFPEETHPLPPFLPENARVLMLGSFPPPRKRWSMDFFYPNLQNDMWRIFGHLFFEDKNHFLVENKKAFDKERLVEFLLRKGIALYDSATTVRRLQQNASDKFLEIVHPTPVSALLAQLPHCHTIAATGQKSMEILLQQFSAEEPKVGHSSEFMLDEKKFRLYRMPSSSRAYPRPVEEKARFYETMLREAGILP